MTAAPRWAVLLAGAVLLCGCDAGSGDRPDPAASAAVDKAVRTYVDFRNTGNLTGLLGMSCDRLYTATRAMLDLPEARRRPIVDAMREHPVQVRSVDVSAVRGFLADAKMTGSAETPSGPRTAAQQVQVRRYRQGYRICRMEP